MSDAWGGCFHCLRRAGRAALHGELGELSLITAFGAVHCAIAGRCVRAPSLKDFSTTLAVHEAGDP